MNGVGMRKWWSVLVLAVALVAVGLDLTVLNLALPTLATVLHASEAQLQWIVDAYSLVVAATLLPAGLLGDRYGRKKLLLAALVLFGLASAACAFAPSASALIAARAVLGLGAAFLIPLSLSVLPVLFTEQERPRALALLAGATFVAYPIGPILGGWLLTHFWWGSVFLINVPIAALATLAVAIFLPESRSAERPGLDLIGVVTSSVGLVGLTYGAIRAGQYGWGNTQVILALAAGALLLVGFVLWQRRLGRFSGRWPLVELGLFRSASFTWGTILATVITFALFGLLFTIPQYFQVVVGTDPLGAGVRLLPVIGGMVIGAGLSVRFARRLGAKIIVALGFAFMAGGLLLGSTTAVSTSGGFTAAWIAAVGFGLGFTLPGTVNAALGTLSAERSGAGSALIGALRQVGGTIGVALLGSLLTSAYVSHLNLAGLPPAAAAAVQNSVSAGVAVAHQIGSAALLNSVLSAFVSGMDAMLVVCAAIAIAGALLALIFLPRRIRVYEAPEPKPADQEPEARPVKVEAGVGS